MAKKQELSAEEKKRLNSRPLSERMAERFSGKSSSDKKSTTMKGGIEKYAKDNEKQKALKPIQKFGIPSESKPNKSTGNQPMDYAKGKGTKTVTKKEEPKKVSESKSASPSMAEKRSAMKPIAGISNTGGALTRVLPSDAIRKGTSKGVQSKKSYSAKEQKIAEIMQKGKKKNGTMKASAQRKISKLRKG
jgi:hypothetical protein